VSLDPDVLSKALTPEGCVEFSVVRKVLAALGLRLVAVPFCGAGSDVSIKIGQDTN